MLKEDILPQDSVLPPSDDAVRQALLRLGAGSNKSQQFSGRRPASLSTSPAARRRFVQDGEVAVEYAERTRPVAADTSGIDGLRAELAQERQARADVELALRDAQASLRSCQTRLGHVELALEEARAQTVALADAATPAPIPDEVARSRRRRAPGDSEPIEGEVGSSRVRRAASEPQPVKWWIKQSG